MKILIIYPHGLGDCILATPMLRALKAQGNKICFAMLERFKSSKIFDKCPYIDSFVWTKDAWNDFPNNNVAYGQEEIRKFCAIYAKENDIEKTVFLDHSRNGNKIIDCLNAFNLPHENFHTEIYIDDSDRELADKLCPKEEFGFIHGYSPSLPSKNFPEGWARENMNKNTGIDKFVEIGVEISPFEIPITTQFEIMRRATFVYLIDSVFYHAAGALDKKIDLAYFKRGESVYNRVKPLHPVEQSIYYRICQ